MWAAKFVRTAFAVHTYNPVFEALVHSPRFVEPAEQLLKDKTYIHQFKINGKAAFDGDVWQWHQDYGTWKADDDMPEARAMNLAVFVDEVNEFNGPLYFIPQSHKKGAIWWFESRATGGKMNAVLKAVLSPDLLDE